MNQSSGSQSQPKVLSKEEEKILSLMLGVKGEKQPMDGDLFQVHVDADTKEDIDFMEKCKGVSFPPYKMLWIWNFDRFVKSYKKTLYDFIPVATAKQMNYLALHQSSFNPIKDHIKVLK